MKILIVDDHLAIRKGLRLIIEQQWPESTVIEAASFTEATVKIAESGFELIVLDTSLPDCGGPEAARNLRVALPATPLIVYSDQDEATYSPLFLKIGVAGFLSKMSEANEVVFAFKRALAGNRYASSVTTDALTSLVDAGYEAPVQGEYNLSKREMKVMVFLAEGLPRAQIAARMGISARTVSNYRGRLFIKMQFKNNADAVKYCINAGYVAHTATIQKEHPLQYSEA